eukprot:SAG31_NODE_3801_length_3870_cov_1.727658_2_plen_265_part_00
MLIDVSGSMRGSSGDIARTAARFMINRFSAADAFAVYVYASTVYQVYPQTGLARGTVENRANAVGALQGRVVEEGEGLGFASDMPAAFAAAFDALTTSSDQSAACRKAIVLFSDNTASYSDSGVLTTVAQRNSNMSEPATVFTYAAGASPTSDGGMIKAIACNNDGIWAAIPSAQADMVKQALSGFYAYYSKAVSHSSGYVVWSEPYTYVGSGFLGVTVSSPGLAQLLHPTSSACSFIVPPNSQCLDQWRRIVLPTKNHFLTAQ